MTVERAQADIVISGGGIAGLTAAAAFGQAGFTVIVAEPTTPATARTDAGADLRTTAFLQPAQAFLDKAGLWSALAPFAEPLQIMRIIDATGTAPVSCDFDASDMGDAPFGWNLPNWLLRREMVAGLAKLPNVDFRAGTAFKDVLPRTRSAIISFDDGTQAETQLLIGADGRASPVRAALGIGLKTTHYGQMAVTFAVTHAAPHDNVSTEVHQSGGPFTLVPLPDRDGLPCSAVVWMTDAAAAKALMDLPDADFATQATTRSSGVLGDLTLASRRMIWPIISQTADRMTGPRSALVAEAAHVMPPIGAQGLNMSLADLDCLLSLAMTHRDDPGAPAVLDQFQKARQQDVRLRVTGIDALNRASIAGHPVLQDLRRTGLRAIHGIAPLREQLMALGLGARR